MTDSRPRKPASPGRHLAFSLSVVVIVLSSLVAGAQTNNVVRPGDSHPSLLLDAKGLAELKQRIATCTWARGSWAQLQRTADGALSQPVELPPRGGNWSHNYVCPTHGARLSQGRKAGPWQWEHQCPVGPHILRGDPSKASLDFDGNAISGIHGRLAQQVVDHGLVYQVTGNERHARRAREILLAYAARYHSYPLHDNQGRTGVRNGGHVASQSLTEASWLIDIAQGADLVWSALSAEDRKGIEEKLLRPALTEVILPRQLGIHNIQCRHNSAIGLVGFLLGDQKLIDLAINDPKNGFVAQIEKGVLEDGMWLEGASGYHFFTINGLWPLAEAARNHGIDLYTRKFEQMFSGPLALAMPDLVLPNFNDSGLVPLQRQAELYELGYARFHQPSYVPLVKAGGRDGRLALLYGATNLASAGRLDPLEQSRNLAASGYAILQAGEGREATWLCLKYGPHGGGHGHPDKNHFILYRHGDIVAIDPGTHAYGSPLHRDWDKTTLAHNTLVVDAKSQTPATGKSLAFGSEKGVPYAMTDAGPIYSGVRFVRTAALITPDLIVFVDQIQSTSPHQYDLAYHQVGTWSLRPEAATGPKAWTSDAPGYSRLTQCVSLPMPPSGLALETTSADSRKLRIVLAGGEKTEIITGYGLYRTTQDLVPTVLQRRQATSTVFAWALALDGEPAELRLSPLSSENGKPLSTSAAVAVQVKSRDRDLALLINPSQESVRLPGSAGSTTSAFLVR